MKKWLVTGLVGMFSVNLFGFYPSNKGDIFKKVDITSKTFNENNAIFLSEVSDLIYNDDNSELTSILKLNKFNDINISTYTEDGISVKVLIAKRDDLVIIDFRGTANQDDILTDLDSNSTSFSDNLPNIKVHKGFLESEKVFEDKFINSKYYDRNLTFLISGHSLGGAVATLFGANLIENDFDNLTLYTFGAPAVGDENFKERFSNKLNLYTVSNYYDIVPFLTDEGFIEYSKPYIDLIGDLLYPELKVYVDNIKDFYIHIGKKEVIKDGNFTSITASYDDIKNNLGVSFTSHKVLSYISNLKEVNEKNDVYHLNKGWNLISVGDCNFDKLKNNIIWGYEDGKWSVNRETQNYDYLNEMKSFKSYWVYTENEENISLNKCDNENELVLEDGWNLVGGVNGSYLDIFSKLDGNLIWRYDRNNQWEVLKKDTNDSFGYQSLDVIEKNDGFWIKK